MKLFIRLVLLSLSIVVFVWGRDIPAYVTAWPKQVSVEKPDPVLGDKLVWEHWIYSEKFAKRFDGFIIEQADPELQDSPIQAIVLRIYKYNFWKIVNKNYPLQYTCNIDIYFDDSIKIPIINRAKRFADWMNYPKGIYASYKQIEPKSDDDKNMISLATPIDSIIKNPAIFSDRPLDGRFARLGVRDYIPTLVNGISVISIQAGVENSIIGPKSSTGIFWLSLFSKLPYSGELSHASKGSYKDMNNITFDSGNHPEEHGFIRLPEAFYNVALQKMTLIKDLNYCIVMKHAHENPVATSEKSTQAYNELSKWCEDAAKNGIIFNPSDYLFQRPKRDGLFETGF